jgi:hypothetical protein
MKGKKELKKRITIRKIERRKKKRRKGVNIQTERERRNKIKKYKMTYYLRKILLNTYEKKHALWLLCPTSSVQQKIRLID